MASYSLNMYIFVYYIYTNLKNTLFWKIEARSVWYLINVTQQWESRANENGREDQDAHPSEGLRAQAPEVCSHSSSSSSSIDEVTRFSGCQISGAGTPWQHPASLHGSRNGLRIITKNTADRMPLLFYCPKLNPCVWNRKILVLLK